MAYLFMQTRQKQYTIREMAGLFGVSCGAYYKWATYGGLPNGASPVYIEEEYDAPDEKEDISAGRRQISGGH
jgi:hypothetical protein